MEQISIVLPINNKKNYFPIMTTWITNVLCRKNYNFSTYNNSYEVNIITDNPDHISLRCIEYISQKLPVNIYIEKEKIGKAQLCAKGFSYAECAVIAKIEADVSFSLDTLPRLCKELQNGIDVIVAFPTHKKNIYHVPLQPLTGSFMFDIQKNSEAGILLFTKKVWSTIQFTPSSDQTFILEFLHRAQEAGFIVKGTACFFQEINNYLSFLAKCKRSVAVGLQMLRVKIKKIHPQYIPPESKWSMINAGVGYKKRMYITHTTLHHTQSAVQSITLKQVFLCGILVECLIILCLFFGLFFAIQVLITILSVIYFLDILFALYLTLKTITTSYEITYTKKELEELQESQLPVYSILCPLYKEAHMLPQFLEGIANIDWPKEKLDVILLLEEDDVTTRVSIDNMRLPSYIRCVIVPHSLPNTKPKACN